MWSRVLIFAVAIIINTDGVFSQKPQLGSAINLLRSYGHLAKNMRVFKGNDGDRWIYREPSVNVFKPPSDNSFLFGNVQTIAIAFNVQVRYCPHFEDLVKEYFDEFKIAGIENTPLAFNTDWSKPTIAKLFGLDKNFVDEHYSYILLKVMRSRDSGTLGNPSGSSYLNETVAKKIKSFTVNDTVSAESFIAEFGTHYISSYTTGDFIYQVFVFTPEHFTYLKNYIPTIMVARLGGFEGNDVFSPQQAWHVGQILSASGSRSLETWAREKLQGGHTTDEVKHYSSLIRLQWNETLSGQLEGLLEDSVILRMNLETLSPVFDSPKPRQMLDQYIRESLKKAVPH